MWAAEVPRVDYDKLTSDRLGESSEAVRARVEEIARMLGGQTITDSTLQHAEEMLLMAPSTPAEKPARFS